MTGKRTLIKLSAIVATTLALAGCVYEPAYAPAPGYYAPAPAYYAPAYGPAYYGPSVGVGVGFGGGWHHHWR